MLTVNRAEPQIDKLPELIGESNAMMDLKKAICQVAPTDATVLILGETGTGKELIAKAIHRKSNRCSGRFNAVNCSAPNPSVLESELFGHEKGAFTGAQQPKQGLFEASNGGTVFLDEIGTATHDTQAKLLRVLQERVIRRVGGIDDIPIDVRIVAATNEDLKELSNAGKFRADLYYRLNVVDLVTTPLRDRGDDSVLLAEHFLAQAATKYAKQFSRLSKQSLDRIRQNPWSGNARELQNVIEKAVILAATAPDDGVMDLPESATFYQWQQIEKGIGAPAVADLVFADLVSGRMPLLGFERNAETLGPVAEALIDALVRGLEQFLDTADGQKKLQNFSQSHIITLIGLPPRRSGNQAAWKESLRRKVIDVLTSRRRELTR